MSTTGLRGEILPILILLKSQPIRPDHNQRIVKTLMRLYNSPSTFLIDPWYYQLFCYWNNFKVISQVYSLTGDLRVGVILKSDSELIH